MQNFCQFIASSPILYAITKTADMAVFVAGITLVASMFFRIQPGKGLLRIIPTAVLIAGNTVFQTLCAFTQADAGGINVYFEALVPFICTVILFFEKRSAKKLVKPVVAAFIYNIVPVFAEIVKLFIPWVNSDNSGSVSTFGLDFITSTAVFIVLLGVYVRLSKKRRSQLSTDRIDLLLYILITLTVSVFIASIAFIDRYMVTDKTNNAYFMLLLNVPTFAFTIAYASRKMVKSRMEAESYRIIMEENIKHYESLEEKNDELRMFRHDFPKTIAPILMCIRNGDTDEAEKILNGFNDTVQATRPRFRTGNHRLDNVLETGAQKAEKHGIALMLENGSTFPKEGIDPADIYTIFPNAIDNAIEGCLRTGAGGVIGINSKIVGNTVFVAISNPCPPDETHSTAGGIVTTKADRKNHGFGTRSILKTCARYGEDNVSFTAQGGVFKLVFSLDFRKENLTEAAGS